LEKRRLEKTVVRVVMLEVGEQEKEMLLVEK
jgi:hypothetical protein